MPLTLRDRERLGTRCDLWGSHPLGTTRFAAIKPLGDLESSEGSSWGTPPLERQLGFNALNFVEGLANTKGSRWGTPPLEELLGFNALNLEKV